MNAHYIIDSAGNAAKCGGEGIGFRLIPSAPRDAAGTVRLGSFPVAVRLRSKTGGFVGEPIEIANSDARFERDAGDEFGSFDIIGGEAGDSWLVETYERKCQGVIPAPGKTRRTCTVQAATAMPTIAPVGAVGFRIRPGTVGHNFGFTGTLQAARIWARMKSGTWIDTLEDIDATVEPVAYRAAWVSADRLYLRSAAATMNVEVDAVEEVG